MRRGAGSPKEDIQDNSTRRSTPKEDGETFRHRARHDATANPAQTRRESAPSCADPPRGLDFRPLQKAWRDLKGRAAGVLRTRVNSEDVGEKGGRVPGAQPQRPSLYLPNLSYSSKLKFRRGNRVYARSEDDGVPIARRHLGGNPSETRFELKTLMGSHPHLYSPQYPSNKRWICGIQYLLYLRYLPTVPINSGGSPSHLITAINSDQTAIKIAAPKSAVGSEVNENLQEKYQPILDTSWPNFT
ncbi:hypothetical protein C8F04DRAFT_1174902 [Mycena alexandri]|uniref:Uncharacterized protein n=1 Tax=Mycena alexandri TaxID=1745969 RepID=A0AAD6TER0_9AGAR|nr:hypothetical protein C8F04DRAFT_1174902 [Mycena alexandri]